MGSTAVGAMVGSTGADASGVVVGAKIFPIHGDVRIAVGIGRVVGDAMLDVGIIVGVA